jgi:hypothetical protein
MKRRLNEFTKQRIPDANLLADGVIGVQNTKQPFHSRLEAGMYGIIVHGSRLCIGFGGHVLS